MARMHTRRRGSSGSDRPAAETPPEWSDVDADAVEERVVELAEQGHAPSEIGVVLRDEGVQGVPVPDVSLVCEKSVTEILEDNDAAPEIPEDLYNLMAKAVRLNDHLRENGTDHQNKRARQNVESKIRRLVNYYRGDELDPEFTYTVEKAREIVE
ncbi:MAG: 30S ribosomal protein S15 [Halococcoides sp.]